MADWLVSQLTTLGVKAEKREIGKHTLDGKEVDLPPVVIGSIGNDSSKVGPLPSPLPPLPPVIYRAP